MSAPDTRPRVRRPAAHRDAPVRALLAAVVGAIAAGACGMTPPPIPATSSPVAVATIAAASPSPSPSPFVGPSPSASLGPSPSASVRPDSTLPPHASPSVAPGSASPSASPLPSHDPRKFGFAAKGMSHEVMAFVTLPQIGYALTEMDLDVVSTIAFFSLEPDANGRIRRDAGWHAWESDQVTRLIERAHAAGTKVVMSLERFSWSSAQTKVTRSILGSGERRRRLAITVADEVVRRGVDGVNVDFEPIPYGQARQFTAFIRALREELDERGPGYQLTFDVTGYHESYDVEALLAPGGADAVFLMGYHYAGTWSKIAGSTAPMGGTRYNIPRTVDSLLKLTEPHRIIVGFPYYGHVWPTVSSKRNARTTGGGFDVIYEKAVALAERLGDLQYDTREQVAWRAYRARPCGTCKLQWYQLYFDDHRALRHKLEFVRERGLLGSGMWTVGFEGGAGALTAEFRRAFLER